MKDPNTVATVLQFADCNTLNTFSKADCIQNFNYFHFYAIRFADSIKVQILLKIHVMVSIKKVP